MKAAIYSKFQENLTVKDLPKPSLTDDAVIIKVAATGICRSDWHAWMGHDSDIVLPHVPGHELAGTIAELGKNVKNWQLGDRVTTPFCGACGHCQECQSGNQQICDNDYQPGFHGWGSFAEYVYIPNAEHNLVALPKEMSFVEAASLGCRFITSYRGIVDQAKIKAGEYLAVYGCGGVGLSAIMIAKAMGAVLIAVDIDDKKLDFAKEIGADFTINAQKQKPIEAIKNLSNGGAHVSVDALGSKITSVNSIKSLRKRGRHIQIGLMLAEQALPEIPMAEVIAKELRIIGSHGMQAHRYEDLFSLIKRSSLPIAKLVGEVISLEEGAIRLSEMDSFRQLGISVIEF